jgi:uncharacterized protein YndB with AHSA1/START domain
MPMKSVDPAQPPRRRRSMLTTFLLIVAALVAALFAYASTRPDGFRVERSAMIAAPPEAIYPLISNFHAWRRWSPYENLDADLKRSYGGAPSGLGAVYEWNGAKAGAGRMEIIEVSPPSRISIKLDFSKPFAAHNTAEFTLSPMQGATKVTWAMSGDSPYMAKLMGVFVSMDQLVGKDFQTGLANLKAAAEN